MLFRHTFAVAMTFAATLVHAQDWQAPSLDPDNIIITTAKAHPTTKDLVVVVHLNAPDGFADALNAADTEDVIFDLVAGDPNLVSRGLPLVVLFADSWGALARQANDSDELQSQFQALSQSDASVAIIEWALVGEPHPPTTFIAFMLPTMDTGVREVCPAQQVINIIYTGGLSDDIDCAGPGRIESTQ